jgi:nitroreductase
VTDAAVAFIVCGQLANHEPMAARLAPSVAGGFMPAELLPIFEGAAKALYSGKPQTQRDEAIRTATFGAAPLMFAARGLDLGSPPMIGFDAEGVAREFKLAQDEVPALLVAVGSIGEGNWPQKPHRPLSEVLDLV